jgi:peptidoglycan-associated lipoprotein
LLDILWLLGPHHDSAPLFGFGKHLQSDIFTFEEEKKMNTRKVIPLLLAIVLLAACSKTVMENQPAVDQEPQTAAQVEPQAQEPEPAVEPQAAIAAPDGREAFLNDYVYFDFDSDILGPDTQSLLQIKAQWLNDNPDVIAVMIEGHCDERGTEEYNLALGAKRAEAVKKYLTDLGLNNLNIQTKSYGEERPVDLEHNEAAWAKNRRACFVIN